MSTVTLTKWGNSVGIRIPAAIMKDAHLTLGAELDVRADAQGSLILTPIKNQHVTWLAQFNALGDSSEDSPQLDMSNDFDVDEWTW